MICRNKTAVALSRTCHQERRRKLNFRNRKNQFVYVRRATDVEEVIVDEVIVDEVRVPKPKLWPNKTYIREPGNVKSSCECWKYGEPDLAMIEESSVDDEEAGLVEDHFDIQFETYSPV